MSLKGKPVTLLHGKELSNLRIKLQVQLLSDFHPKSFSRLWMSWIHVNGVTHMIDALMLVCPWYFGC